MSYRDNPYKCGVNGSQTLKSLVLIDTEFPEDIEYSEIKLSPEWDGFSVDKNDSNNLVYSDYFKTESAD